MGNLINQRQRIIKHIVPALVAGTVFMIILILNGLWPFGKVTIDYYDMAQWADVFYYHNYDELRGLKSPVFDWYLNLGRPIPGPGYMSLFDLTFLVIPRDRFLEAMSILMLLKIMAAASAMSIFLHYINSNLPDSIRVMLSAGYGLCGYVMVNYTAPQWVDMVILVPLLLMYVQEAVRTGRIMGLSITVFLLMIDEYYFAIQTIISIFLVGGAYLICTDKGGSWKDRVVQPNITSLAMGMLTGLAISAFSWLPNVVFGMSSARFGRGTGGGLFEAYKGILANTEPAYLSRWFTLLGLAFPAALVAHQMIRWFKSRDWRKLAYAIVCIFMFMSQLLLESIHLLLHFGSYVNYPVRNGFMIYCIMAAIAAKYYSTKQDWGERVTSKGKLLLVAIEMIAVCFVTFGFNYCYKKGPTRTDHDILIFTMGVMALFSLIHFALIAINKYDYSICVWCLELLIFGIIMIGKPIYNSPYGNDPEQEGDYIRIADQLVGNFRDELRVGDEAATLRIKNPDTSLNANYGEIMRRETLSGWTNLETEEQISGAISLGYSSQLTRLLDSGGNIFSDTILHITEAVSYQELDERLYKKISTTRVVTDYITGESRDYHLYQNRFEIPFVIPVNKIPNSEHRDTVDLINEYASAMGAGNEIAYKIDVPFSVTSDNGHEIYDYNIDISGHKTLYFTGRCVDTDYYNTRFSVNDIPIGIPSIKEYDNKLFPAHFNNNTVELGSFDNEAAHIRIDMDVSNRDQKYDFYLYVIDRDALDILCKSIPDIATVEQGKRSLKISLKGVASNYAGVMIPVSFDRGWRASVNGTSVDIMNVNGLFMYIPISPGNCDIYLSYFPPMMGLGIVIAVAGLICMVIYMRKFRDYTGCRINRILINIYKSAFVTAFVFVYMVPIVYALFMLRA